MRQQFNRLVLSIAVLTLLSVCARTPALAVNPLKHEPGGVIFHGVLDGDLLGYDIDQSGKEGVLAESLALGDGKDDVAVETFDQSTGKILKVIREIKETTNDFDVTGIVGNDVGVVLYQALGRNGLYRNNYKVLDPLKNGAFTGKWTPKFNGHNFLLELSKDQGHSETAVLGGTDTGNAYSYVFESNVAANTFGQKVWLTDLIFDFNEAPVMALDSVTNVAVVGSSYACGTCGTEIGFVDLSQHTFSEFPGLGLGFVNGIAVDSADGIACTTTAIDDGVEFYNLANQAGFETSMESVNGQPASFGTDVQFDPINKLFLIAQPIPQIKNGSSVQVFDTSGNFVEGIGGLNLPVAGTFIALNPNTRMAFLPVVTGIEVKELQSISY